jgi:uncharacterized protein YecE (DUF72 family)
MIDSLRQVQYIGLMEFGRGPGDTFGIPTLPPEHPVTTELLRATESHGADSPLARRALELFPEEPAQVRIGLSTWGDKAYRGTIYPPDARPGDFLHRYGEIFSTVELSATFYGMPDEARFAGWREAVPETFRFLPKVSQAITHRRALVDAQQGLRHFLDRTAALGGRRGPLLLQMPPRFAPDAVAGDRLAAALAVLRRSVAVELRHPGWFRDGEDGEPPPAAQILREYGATLAVTDTVGAREVAHAILTSPTLVLRFVTVGDATVDAVRIDQWADRITDWLTRGLREAYIFIHGDDPLATRRLAARLGALLERATTGSGIAEILGPAGGAEAPDGAIGASTGAREESGAATATANPGGTDGESGEAATGGTRRRSDPDGQLSLF